MPASVWTELLLIFSEPFFVLCSMSTVTAILAPNDHALAETALAYNTQFVAFAVALGNGFLAPSTRDVVAGVALGDICEHFILGHHDGVCCDFVHLEVVKELDVREEDLVHEVLGNQGGVFVHETDGCDHC